MFPTAFLSRLFFIAAICLFWSGPAAAARRAFVVGIDRYDNLEQFRQLQRAINDAEAIAEALSALGFVTVLKRNTSQSDFFLEFDAFLKTVQENDVVAFFFSGHGIQIGGLNYLLPSDAPAVDRTVEDLLKGRSIQFSALLDQMNRKNPSVRLVIIDACRDNPYQIQGRSIGATRGLAGIGRIKGTFIMFSADTGQNALDRLPAPIADDYKNSPYTRTLIPLLREPGHTLPDIARRVRRGVEELVEKVPHEQSPAYYDGISGDFCLTGDCKSLEELRREAERGRKEEMQRLEHLDRLRTEAQGAIARIEEAERAAKEARSKAEFAQRAAREAELRSAGTQVAALPKEDAKPDSKPSLAQGPELITQIQTQLQRLGCFRGTPDGVWGEKVKDALKRFSEATKFNIPRDNPTDTALTVLSGRTDAVCTIYAPGTAVPKKAPSRPNAVSYSMSVWGSGTVPTGSTVSTTTPYGRLTCVGGSIQTGAPRVCRWH
jgi:hypothetical protein